MVIKSLIILPARSRKKTEISHPWRGIWQAASLFSGRRKGDVKSCSEIRLGINFRAVAENAGLCVVLRDIIRPIPLEQFAQVRNR